MELHCAVISVPDKVWIGDYDLSKVRVTEQVGVTSWSSVSLLNDDSLSIKVRERRHAIAGSVGEKQRSKDNVC